MVAQLTLIITSDVLFYGALRPLINKKDKRIMRKEDVTDGIIEEIGDLASNIVSNMWDIEEAVDKINNKLGELQKLKKTSESARSMTIEEIAQTTKLYRRMRQAQKEGDDVLVDFILEQIDALVE